MLQTQVLEPYDVQYLELLIMLHNSNPYNASESDEESTFHRLPFASISVNLTEEFPLLKFLDMPVESIIEVTLKLIGQCADTLSRIIDILSGENVVTQSMTITTTEEDVIVVFEKFNDDLYGNITISGDAITEIPLKISAYSLLLRIVSYVTGLHTQYVTFNIISPEICHNTMSLLKKAIRYGKLLENMSYSDDEFRKELSEGITNVSILNAIKALDSYPRVQIFADADASIFDIEAKDIEIDDYFHI